MEPQQGKENSKEQNKTNEITLTGVGTQGKPESICATLRDPIWIV